MSYIFGPVSDAPTNRPSDRYTEASVRALLTVAAAFKADKNVGLKFSQQGLRYSFSCVRISDNLPLLERSHLVPVITSGERNYCSDWRFFFGLENFFISLTQIFQPGNIFLKFHNKIIIWLG